MQLSRPINGSSPLNATGVRFGCLRQPAGSRLGGVVEEEVAQEQRGENNRGLEVKHGSMWLMVDGWSLLEPGR